MTVAVLFQKDMIIFCKEETCKNTSEYIYWSTVQRNYKFQLILKILCQSEYFKGQFAKLLKTWVIPHEFKGGISLERPVYVPLDNINSLATNVKLYSGFTKDDSDLCNKIQNYKNYINNHEWVKSPSPQTSLWYAKVDTFYDSDVTFVSNNKKCKKSQSTNGNHVCEKIHELYYRSCICSFWSVWWYSFSQNGVNSLCYIIKKVTGTTPNHAIYKW